MKGLVLAVSVVFSAAGCTGSDAGGMAGGPPGPTTIQMGPNGTFMFSPQTSQAHAGQQVVFNNASGGMNHTATKDGALGPDSDSVDPSGVPNGQTYTFTIPPTTPSGTKIFFHCRFHGAPGDGTHLGGGMAGEIDVL